jgi:hypothetical protein
LDRVPDALLVRAVLSVTAWLAPAEMTALRRESRRRRVAPSRLARDLIVSSLQSTRREKRRGNHSEMAATMGRGPGDPDICQFDPATAE